MFVGMSNLTELQLQRHVIQHGDPEIPHRQHPHTPLYISALKITPSRKFFSKKAS